MALAGGFAVGDRVICRGLPGTVVGGPARAACNRLSVAVRYDDGRIADERVVNLELLVEEPMPDDEDDDRSDSPPPMPQPAAEDQGRQQRAASDAMWAQSADMSATPERQQQREAPGVFGDAEEEASPADSPDSRYDDRGNAQGGYDERANGVGNAGGQQFGPGTAGYGADDAEAALLEKIYANYEDLRSAFRAIDQSNNGYVSKEDFFQAMGRIFLSNGFSEDDVYEVADRFDLNRDGYISYEEFVAIVEGSDKHQEDRAPEEPSMDDPKLVSAVDLAIQKFKVSIDQRYNSLRKAFLSLDTSRSGSLTPQNFAKALTIHGVFLTPPELELAWSVFDRNGTGVISYLDFCAVMTQRLQFGSHLDRQMFM